MEETLLNLAKLSPVVAVLCFIVWTQHRRVERFEAASTAREAEAKASCEKREQALADRLTVIESRSHQQLSDLVATNAETQRVYAETTRSFARSLDRWSDRLDAGTDRHPSRSV